MTAKLDGTNGLLQAYDYQVLTTGFTYTFASGTQTLIANPAATLATGTITMPATPADGMVITIQSTQQVTAVTVAANTGQTLVGGASQLIPNQPLAFVYRLANTTWYPMAGGAGRASALVSGTAVASTSGTSIDFTGIPSWVKRITVMLKGVSTSSTSPPQIQIGSGSVTTSGYLGSSTITTNITVSALFTTGFGIGVNTSNWASVVVVHGAIVLTLQTGNNWVCAGSVGRSDTASTYSTNGSCVLSGTLDRVRITTVNGTDTFTAGSINILYE